MSAGKHHGYLIFNTNFDVALNECRGCKQGAHMRIEVSRFKSHCSGPLYLRPDFRFHFVGAGMFYHIGNATPHGALGIG